MTVNGITLVRLSTALLLGVSSLTIASVACAQAAPRAETASQPVSTQTVDTTVSSEEDASAKPEGEIVVTGSRIPTAGFTAPTPVTVVGSEQLTKVAPSTIAEALRQLPSLTNTSGPQRNSGTSQGGQSFLNLRSLGATRTLTLLDGRRVVATNLTGSVDVNIMPAGIVQRVEVVTGGASAAYGSDAVAGVVNFILDKDFTGIKGEVNSGITTYGDGAEFRATLSGGTKFAGGAGHLLLSGEYYDTKGIPGGSRNWNRQGVALINNPSGTPTLIEQRNVLTVGTYGGLITTGNGGTAANNALFRGIQFLPGGVPASYNFGTLTTSTQQVGGDGVPTEYVQEVSRPLKRGSVFGRASFDVADNVTLFAEGLYGTSTSTVVNSLNRRQTANPLTIQRDNAFLPDSIRQRMLLAGVTSLTLLRFSPERGYVTTLVDSDTLRGTAGVNAKLGSLNLNGYYQYGRTIQVTDVQNDEITARMNLAVDSVLSGGQIVCRSTLTSPTNGCVPFNPFGVGSPSEAALDYTRGTSHSRALLKEHVVALSLAGPLFEGWAGPISFAVGGEYRTESVHLTTDALSPTGAFLFGNPTPWDGNYNVKEGFVEVAVPLLKDLSFARELSFNGAGRVTEYSTSGRVQTWKLGLSYKPIDDLRLRGTRSRDIRAPNLSELFSAGRQSIASVNDPLNNNVLVSGIPQQNKGNPNLVPEIADTLTFGAIYSPSWATGLNLSVDYYDIKIRDAIGTIGAQTAVDQCAQNVAAACALITRNAANAITGFNAFPINLASAKTRGVDIELGYRMSAQSLLGVDGTLSFRALASYVGKQETQTPGAAPIDRAGEVGVNPYPYWRGTAQINYDSDTMGAFLQTRFVGGGAYDVTRGPAVVDLQHIAAQAYLDGQISWKGSDWGGNFELFLNVRNILNNDPPFAPQDGNIPVPVNVTLHDATGRTFRVGAKFRF